MKRFLSRCVLMSAWVSLLAFSNPAFAKTDVEFILDASGSMRAAMEGKTQMDVAKQSIRTALESIPADTHVALRVYAHRVGQENKTESCVDSELMIPFGPLDKASFTSKVDSIQPKGYTPIAYSLEQTEKDFGVERESEKVIILVSDGEETCGGDPVKVVKDLIAKGFKIKVNAIGFKADARAQAQLKAIAEAGGGKYYDAQDSSSLNSSLKDITQKALLVEKTNSVYGSEVQGGSSYETATTIPLGQELRLNHYQRRAEYDYFYVDLKAGQSLKVTMKTGTKGASVEGTSVKENDYPYAGFQIHNSERTKVAGEEIIGGANAIKTSEVAVGKTGRYYILVGSIYEAQHKDHPFKVEITEYFDAGQSADAGSSFETAMPIQRQSYPTNYLTKADDSDMFVFPTSRGETLVIKIVPQNPQITLRATLLDDIRAELGSGASPNQGAGFRVSAVATGSMTYLKIYRSYSDEDTKYSFEFEGAAPAAGVLPTSLPTSLPSTLPASPTTPTTIVPPPPTTMPQAAPMVSAPPSFPSNPAVTTPTPTQEVKPEVPQQKREHKPVVGSADSKKSRKNEELETKSIGWADIQWTDKDTLKFLGTILGTGAGIGFILGIMIRGMFVKKPKKEAA